MDISILNYGLGNLGSVGRMIEKAGGSAKIITTPREVLHASKIVLPGVGNFDCGAREIYERDLSSALRVRVLEEGVPILGICLGMQLLCTNSEEGTFPGLGFVDAEVKRFDINVLQNLKVPHMGWKHVRVLKSNPLIDLQEEFPRFYFVHSYYVAPRHSSLSIGSTTHGISFCAAFQYENIFGTQFHPEKSHRFGLKLFRNFVNI